MLAPPSELQPDSGGEVATGDVVEPRHGKLEAGNADRVRRWAFVSQIVHIREQLYVFPDAVSQPSTQVDYSRLSAVVRVDKPPVHVPTVEAIGSHAERRRANVVVHRDGCPEGGV